MAVDAVWLAERPAVVAVLLAALRAVRPVVVAPRLAVATARFVDVRAEVAVPFTLRLAARAVLVPPPLTA